MAARGTREPQRTSRRRVSEVECDIDEEDVDASDSSESDGGDGGSKDGWVSEGDDSEGDSGSGSDDTIDSTVGADEAANAEAQDGDDDAAGADGADEVEDDAADVDAAAAGVTEEAGRSNAVVVWEKRKSLRERLADKHIRATTARELNIKRPRVDTEASASLGARMTTKRYMFPFCLPFFYICIMQLFHNFISFFYVLCADNFNCLLC